VKLYYKNYQSASVRFSINYDTTQWVVPLKKSSQLQEWVYRGRQLKSIKFTFEPFDSLRLFGASFEDGPGLYVDNFSLRGNSGISLTGISKNMLTKFNGYRSYKLVILQFGLNMVQEDSLNYRSYVRRMVKVINNLKKSFPQASFLLMSVSDRSSNTTGKFETMNAIPAMRNAQRMIAQETNIAFWDMFEAMGGENSMVKFVTSKPALAAKDYTHLNFNGGKKLAGSLVKSLLYGHEAHEKKNDRKK
jgi:lysophospholipase L1-like esterase